MRHAITRGRCEGSCHTYADSRGTSDLVLQFPGRRHDASLEGFVVRPGSQIRWIRII
jgi:hypothetical protein